MYPTIRILSIVALILGIQPSGISVEPPGTQSPVSIDILINQLGHKHFRVRQAAGKSLEERGEEALPILRKSLEHPDLEIRRRVEVLTEKIERNLLLSPKRVTLKMTNRPIGEVLKEITRQTGYKFEYQDNNGQREGGPKITLDLKDASYWEAMQKICSTAGLSYNGDEQQGHVYLYAQNTVSPFTSMTGPFRFVASNFSYNRYLNLANLPKNGIDPNLQQDNLGFAFFIQAEPKAPLLQVGTPRLLKAVDENGGSLMPHSVGEAEFTVRYYDFNQYRSFQHQANLAMHKSNKDAQKAKLIQGKVMLTLLASVRPDAVVDKLSVGMKKKLSGTGISAEVEVQDLKEQNNKNYSVTLLIKRRGAVPENDYNWINTVQQKLELVDERGRKYICQGASNFLGNTPTSVHGTYIFYSPQGVEVGKPVKLILNQWLSISQEVEFEFKDVPLP